MAIINKKHQTPFLILRFFWYALINPVSILAFIVLGCFNLHEPLIKFLNSFFPGIAGITGLYIWMAAVFSVVIFLNYLLFGFKNFNKETQKSPFKDFLNLYFKSQKVYWIWGRMIVFPFIYLGAYAYIVGQGTAIYLVVLMYPWHPTFYKALYLIFGLVLMICSYIHYRKLMRKKKIGVLNGEGPATKITKLGKLIGQFFWCAFLNPVPILVVFGLSFLNIPGFFNYFIHDLVIQILSFNPTTLYLWIIGFYAVVVFFNYFMFPLKNTKHNRINSLLKATLRLTLNHKRCIGSGASSWFSQL